MICIRLRGNQGKPQQLLRELYHTGPQFLSGELFTCGNEAMILAGALEGQEIMIARNAHKSP